jgi:glyoxylase-like metal-dependent hydrolase (beta-lactamase superfamily II)
MDATQQHKVKVGKFEVIRVVEDASPTSPRFLWHNGSRETLAPHLDWLAPHFYTPDTNRIRMQIKTMVLKTPHHTILVDTCLGNHKKRDYEGWNMRTGPFLEDLGRAGVRPDDVDYVICTHLHVDHVGWNTRFENGKWVPTFPKAQYLFAEPEYLHWKEQKEGEFGEIFRDSVKPIVDAGLHRLVPVDFTVEDGVRFESTPGHTPGHCSVHLTSGGQEAVITGDMMHHPIQIAEPDWASKFDTDPAMGTATRRAFCNRYADRDVQIIGTHFSVPSLRIVGKGDQWRVKVV